MLVDAARRVGSDTLVVPVQRLLGVSDGAMGRAIDRARREPHWGDMPLSNPPRPGLGYPEEYRVPSPSLRVRHQEQIDRVLAVLDEDERKMFVSKAAGLPDAEIAERFGYAVKTVRTKLSSARAKVKHAFPEWREDFDLP